MGVRKYLTCLWPGLSELWWRGRLSALPIAVGFAFGLNFLLILKYFYPHWLSPMLVRSAWWVGGIGWIYLTIRSFRELPSLIEPRAVSDEPDRFPEAHAAYLRGEWDSCEQLLLSILRIEPRDPPSLLMLASVYRHRGRLENAIALLDELRRLEVADSWQIEIEAESQRIERAQNVSEQSDQSGESEAADDANVAAADLTAA